MKLVRVYEGSVLSRIIIQAENPKEADLIHEKLTRIAKREDVPVSFRKTSNKKYGILYLGKHLRIIRFRESKTKEILRELETFFAANPRIHFEERYETHGSLVIVPVPEEPPSERTKKKSLLGHIMSRIVSWIYSFYNSLSAHSRAFLFR